MITRNTTRVIIYKDGKILLSKNEKTDFWYPGGGGLEEGEDLIACCKREVFEETGQKIEVIDLMYLQEFYYKDGSKKNLEFFFLAKPLKDSKDDPFHIDGDKDAEDKVFENRWFSKEDIEKEKILVYPEIIRDKFWKDIKKFNFKEKRYYKSLQE